MNGYLTYQIDDTISQIRKSYDPIHEVRTQIEQLTVTAVCGRQYIRVESLKQFLRSPVDAIPRGTRLLKEVYADTNTFSPIQFEHISESSHCCLLVFCILLEIRRGRLINACLERSIIDSSLPISPTDLRKRVRPKFRTDAEADRFVKDFDELQYRYCPARFELEGCHEHQKKKVIPVCKKENIKTGGTASLWLILVQEEFIGEKMQDILQDSRLEDPKYGYCYQVALKTFEQENKSLWENEKLAFIGLRKHEGMIRYLGAYEHREVLPPTAVPSICGQPYQEERTKLTFNILLEYAQFDLKDLFIGCASPVLKSEIETFWIRLFEIADAVDGIHNLKTEQYGSNREFYGWHADIKPDNILSVQDRYKLADPGFAAFVEKKENDGAQPTTFILGGTETYGPPERHHGRRGTRTPVTQSIDMWSLGCVFSVAATWVVLGSQGIPQFTKLRANAIENIIKEKGTQVGPRVGSFELRFGDYFHDGREVLDDVRRWHELLRTAIRGTDKITGRVLDLIDKEMLLGTGAKRITAKDLCAKLKLIATQVNAEPKTSISESIRVALYEIDDAAPLDTVSTKSNLTETPHISNRLGLGLLNLGIEGRKSKLDDITLKKTIHRAENLRTSPPETERSAEERFCESPVEDTALFDTNDIPEPVFAVASPSHSEKGLAESTKAVPNEGHLLPFMHPRPKDYLNVFQARDQFETHQKGKSRLSIAFRRTKKDETLKQYFSNRDIIFLVDNAESMSEYWYEATFLLETLVNKAFGIDDNGMDLRFTLGTEKLDGGRTSSPFTTAMRNARPQPQSSHHTDMRRSLGDILANYIKQVERSIKYRDMNNVKDLTLIVLTDGIWAGTLNKHDVDQTIIMFAKHLKGLIGELRLRPVSIEFIQFGCDEEATKMLKRLDDDLDKENIIPDIVDTEMFYTCGDINKMLLGSFVEEYDMKGSHSSIDLISQSHTPEAETRSLAEKPSRTSIYSKHSSMDEGPAHSQRQPTYPMDGSDREAAGSFTPKSRPSRFLSFRRS